MRAGVKIVDNLLRIKGKFTTGIILIFQGDLMF